MSMFDEIKGLFYTLFILKPNKNWLINLAYIGATVLVMNISYNITYSLLAAKTPIITLLAPTRDITTTEASTIIVGNVTPSGSEVKVNGKPVGVNQQGGFTVPLEVKVGNTKVEVSARNGWKSSMVKRTIAREAESIATINLAVEPTQSPVTQVLAEEVLSEEEKQKLEKSMLLDLQEVKKDETTVVRGRFQNKTIKTIGWIKLTATFYDQAGTELDKQTGYITNIDQYLAPQAVIPFQISPTKSQYATYNIAMEYDGM